MTQAEAILRLRAEGVPESQARRMVFAAAAVAATMEVCMPFLGDEWETNGFRITRGAGGAPTEETKRDE